MSESRMAQQMGAVDYSAGLTVSRSRDRGYDWLTRDLKRRVKRGDRIRLDASGNVVGIMDRQEPGSAVEVVLHESQSRVDLRAARSAAIAVDQRPLWLQRIMSLERTQIERGGRVLPIIDATGIYPSIDRVRRGLNGHASRGLTLLHKVTERRTDAGIIPGFHQEVVEHPLSVVPPIVVVQDRDSNPNARVKIFFSDAGEDVVLRAVSGVDRRDERTIVDVFKAEGYRTDRLGSVSTGSVRE